MPLQKESWDWKRFREGVEEEGIPLAGATIGAAIGAPRKAGLAGAALGYAGGGLASLAKAKAQGEPMSESRKLLAGGALGYGVGGLGYVLTKKKIPATAAAGKGMKATLARGLHGEHSMLSGALEEGMPAAGAVLGTGTAMGLSGSDKKPGIKPPLHQPQQEKVSMDRRFEEAVLAAMLDELSEIDKVAFQIPGLSRVQSVRSVMTDASAKAMKAGATGAIPKAAPAAPLARKVQPVPSASAVGGHAWDPKKQWANAIEI